MDEFCMIYKLKRNGMMSPASALSKKKARSASVDLLTRSVTVTVFEI